MGILTLPTIFANVHFHGRLIPCWNRKLGRTLLMSRSARPSRVHLSIPAYPRLSEQFSCADSAWRCRSHQMPVPFIARPLRKPPRGLPALLPAEGEGWLHWSELLRGSAGRLMQRLPPIFVRDLNVDPVCQDDRRTARSAGRPFVRAAVPLAQRLREQKRRLCHHIARVEITGWRAASKAMPSPPLCSTQWSGVGGSRTPSGRGAAGVLRRPVCQSLRVSEPHRAGSRQQPLYCSETPVAQLHG